MSTAVTPSPATVTWTVLASGSIRNRSKSRATPPAKTSSICVVASGRVSVNVCVVASGVTAKWSVRSTWSPFCSVWVRPSA